MAYRKTYFRIRTKGYSTGWVSDADRFTKGQQNLYLHPTSFSGVMDETNIQPLQGQMLDTQAFRCYHVDCYEGYRAELEARRSEITAYIPERCKTKRSNLYIVAPVAEDVASKLEICRLCDKDRRNRNGKQKEYYHEKISFFAYHRAHALHRPVRPGLRR